MCGPSGNSGGGGYVGPANVVVQPTIPDAQQGPPSMGPMGMAQPPAPSGPAMAGPPQAQGQAAPSIPRIGPQPSPVGSVFSSGAPGRVVGR